MPGATLDRLDIAPKPQNIAERTGLADRPILLLGAGSGLGESLARRLAQTYLVIAGTRSQTNFDALKANIASEGGRTPIPLLADITRPDEFQAAFDGLGLERGAKLHYMPVAAGGLEGLQRGIVGVIGPLNRIVRAEQKISQERMLEATAQMRGLVLEPQHLEAAMRVNRDSPAKIFDMLKDHGHIDERSEVVNTSSSISDGVDLEEVLNNPQKYKGPWFYYTIGVSKKAGVAALDHNRHLDMVAPELPDTKVGGVIDGLERIMDNVEPSVKFTIPKIPRDRVAEAIVTALMVPASEKRTLYIDELGKVGQDRPNSWDQRFVPYL